MTLTETTAPQPVDLPPLYELAYVERVDSAGACAERLAREGAGEGTIVWAGAQEADLTAGGTPWFSPAGNLYCALILEPEFNLASCMQLGFVAMTSMGAALAAKVTPMTSVGYRLPGRISVNGLRSGRLQLSAGRRDGGPPASAARPFDYLVLAWAVNVASHPPNPEPERYNALHPSGAMDVTPSALLEAYARYFLSEINRWAEDGFGPVRRSWLAGAEGIGEPISLSTASGEPAIEGSFAGLDETGRAVIDTNAGTRHFADASLALAARIRA